MNTTFILDQYIVDISVCDQLITLHQNKISDYKFKDIQTRVDPKIKDSVDISISNYNEYPPMIYYMKQLQGVVDQYIKLYPNCNKFNPWGITEPVNIQYYKPGAGYHAWHCERSSPGDRVSKRHLVFMTYLNDVTEGGETEFLHQELKIQPRKGLTLIWPSDWTHVHRGITSLSQEKYIVTGWFSWLDK